MHRTVIVFFAFRWVATTGMVLLDGILWRVLFLDVIHEATLIVLALQGAAHLVMLIRLYCIIFCARLCHLLHLLFRLSRGRCRQDLFQLFTALNWLIEKVRVQTVSWRPSLIEERSLCRVKTLVTAALSMLATVLRALINRPSFIITPILSSSFDLDGVRQATRTVPDETTCGSCATATYDFGRIFRWIEFWFLLKVDVYGVVHFYRVLILTESSDISCSIHMIHGSWWGLIWASSTIFSDFGLILINHRSLYTCFFSNLLPVYWRQYFGLMSSLLLRNSPIRISYNKRPRILLGRTPLGGVLSTDCRLDAIRLTESLLLVAHLLLVFDQGRRFISITPDWVHLLRSHGRWCLSLLCLRYVFDLNDFSLNQGLALIKRGSSTRLFYWYLREGLFGSLVL